MMIDESDKKKWRHSLHFMLIYQQIQSFLSIKQGRKKNNEKIYITCDHILSDISDLANGRN